MDFPGLIHCQKVIASFSGWSKPEEETGYMIFSAPLSIAGAAETAFNLHGGCYWRHADKNVTFELVLGKTPTRRRVVLKRIEWRSLQGGHSNKRGRPPGLIRRTEATHCHEFDLNYVSDLRRMRGGNLPFADNIRPEIETFEQLREFVGRRLNIQNIGVVAIPDWEYGLF